MRGELVAIDLETNGLDPEVDGIIEIGAVRMRDGVVIQEFSTLINPGVPISAYVANLTGITDVDLASAPRIGDMLSNLVEFVGNAPIVGHNISFDTGFLYKQGVLRHNPRIDTYELAAVLLPRALRYNLGSLTADLGVVLEHAHRALDDARAAALVYYKLWDLALQLPAETVRAIADAAQDLSEWDAKVVFEALAREKSGAVSELNLSEVFTPYHETTPPLQPALQHQPLDVDAVAAALDEHGVLAGELPAYERREQQIGMARAIAEAFNDPHHLLVEAGTGTGKSLAYLIPSLLWATQNGERVVVSTNTINLQDQLMAQDIPLLAGSLGVDFRATVMKGRGNYLCPRRLMGVRRRRPTSIEEMRTLAKILVWLLDSATGDRTEINLRGPGEHQTWHRLSAEDEDCTLHRCEAAMGGACPFYKARKTAERAHLVIVNHALLISDAAADNRVLPEYQYAVLDEGHQLEDTITNGMGVRMDEAMLLRRLADLGTRRRGLLGDLLQNSYNRVPEKDYRKLEAFITSIETVTDEMRVHIGDLFKALGSFIVETHNGKTPEFYTPIRFTSALRAQHSFPIVQGIWTKLDEYFTVLSDGMNRLAAFLGKLETYNIPTHGDLVNSVLSAARHLADLRGQLGAFLLTPDQNTIYWINTEQSLAEISLRSAPLHIGGMMEQYLWQRKQSVVITSATLRTGDNFAYIQDRLRAEATQTLEVGSPFNYRESTLLYIPEDMPDPNMRQAYQQAVERGLIELATALNGRVLALFTSYAQLKQTAQAIEPRLALGDIAVYGQNENSSRQALLEGFKSTPRSVLLGTRSFWEGVDIPGKALSALVIVRLPFAVPNDPIFTTRSESYSDSFNQYAIPDAILRFRQGFGRLIRSSTDRGIVTVFDSRIVHKNYGALFLQALPECTLQRGKLSGLAAAAQHWLKEEV
jgi:ATP-dependent DNA helicase DinG